MPEINPYAPPRDLPLAAIPAAAQPPLPEGIRRYGYDPAALHDYVAKRWRALVVRLVLFFALYTAFQTWRGVIYPETLIVLVPLLVAYFVVASLWRRAQLRRLEPKLVLGYELLVAPRAMRRTAYGVPPAEIVAADVTSIVEVPDGLSIEARGAARRLFVFRGVAGYAEVRDHVARWGAIEARFGLGAWRRKLAHRFGERTCDPRDPIARGEIEALRALARPVDDASIRAIRARRVLMIVLVAAATLLLVYQLLQPPLPR